jgi:cell division protein FtsW
MAASPPVAERHGWSPFVLVEKQVFFGGVAFFVMILTSMMSPQAVRRWAVIGFLMAFVALIAVLLVGQDHGKGATRWLSIGSQSIQPAEFMKPVFLVTVAWLMAAAKEINGPPGNAIAVLIAVLVAGLLVMQPDFGQACLILFGWGVMYFVAGAPMLLISLSIFSVITGGIIAYNSSEHFARRIDGYLTSEVDPTTQLGYAATAIQDGGLWGLGVGNGQIKWFLADGHTDFIIAVGAEEFGLMVALAIIGLYGAVVFFSLMRLFHERDTFVRLAGTGLISVFGIQAVVNLGVAVRLLPAKGMTLPFVSYGGSSLVAGGLAIGMLLAFTRARPQKDISDIFSGRG